MKCPSCQQELKAHYIDTSNNPDNGKIYNRSYYKCEKDDIWICVEIPIEKNNLA